jgi:hypothetical protein
MVMGKDLLEWWWLPTSCGLAQGSANALRVMSYLCTAQPCFICELMDPIIEARLDLIIAS